MARIHKFTSAEQYNALRSAFPDSLGELRHDGFIWWMQVRPEESSKTYKIRIKYKDGKSPETFVVSPRPLKLADGATSLPHTYDTNKQQLCLFQPGLFEWNSSMLISETIVHWAIQWLVFYEIWQLTGTWTGGGHGDHNVKMESKKK